MFQLTDIPWMINTGAVASILYLVAVFRLDEWRKENDITFDERYRIYASWWFWGLGVYSMVTTVSLVAVPMVMDTTRSDLCRGDIFPLQVQDWIEKWLTGFFFSKLVELGDSFWLILCNRNIIFLHWFHHLTTLWYVLYCMYFFPTSGAIFAFINLNVHSIMYLYFSGSIHPKRLSVFPPHIITIAQIVQMIIGVVVNLSHFFICRPDVLDVFGLAMYTSYFFLFYEFFQTKYKKSNQA